MPQRVAPEVRIESLCRAWQQARDLETASPYEYDFNDFYKWVLQHDPEALNFIPKYDSVKLTVEYWFDRFFGMG
jgi:hypothetical protein